MHSPQEIMRRFFGRRLVKAGYSIEEIAAMTGTTVAAVKAALHRGRAGLRAIAAEPAEHRMPALAAAERARLTIETPRSLSRPTHWSFGQLASLAGAPPSCLRELPAALAADCINYGLHYGRAVEEVGVLLTRRDETLGSELELRAATGPRYGRIWNGGEGGVVDALVHRFGDGISGDWRVPGEFGREVVVTKENTTLFASDRDLFVFVADEKNRIEVPGRRRLFSGGTEPGLMARGFFVWNSEVGDTTLGAGFFLFDYVCCNRIVWGARDYNEVRIRHTSGAPDRWLEEVVPVLTEYANGSAEPVVAAIEAAKLEEVDKFLSERFGKRLVADLKEIHAIEERRPIETLWDVTTAVTAYARSVPNSDRRIALEREAGKVMQLAA
jgi:hypothetical protein